MRYYFRKAEPGEPAQVYAMIEDRVQWMDEQGIRQWNTTDYLNAYPLAYYQEHLSQLYVLVEEGSRQILSAAILKEQDERWDSAEPAFYIHNFVSVRGRHDIGKVLIGEAERYARQQGKIYMRLDSAVDNEALARYYESMGYMPCGFCQDGEYHGILRQKRILAEENS